MSYRFHPTRTGIDPEKLISPFPGVYGTGVDTQNASTTRALVVLLALSALMTVVPLIFMIARNFH